MAPKDILKTATYVVNSDTLLAINNLVGYGTLVWFLSDWIFNSFLGQWTYLFTAVGLLISIFAFPDNRLLAWNPSAKLDWAAEIVLITGGGTGLGATLARKLAQSRLGVKVVVLTNHAASFPAELGIHTYICDVSSKTELDQVAARVRAEVGHPTMLVNNAGVVQGKLLLDLEEEDVRNTFNVNSIAPFWTIQAFLPEMLRRRKGHVVNVSSVMGLVGVAQMSDYCASKAATVAFHASLRTELDVRYDTPEIKTTLVLPGQIDTGMFNQIKLTNPLVPLIAPTLSQDTVAAAIIRALEGRLRQTTLRLPLYTHSARILGPGPSLMPRFITRSLQVVSRRTTRQYFRLTSLFTQQDFAMREYGPHPDAGERLAAERATKPHKE